MPDPFLSSGEMHGTITNKKGISEYLSQHNSKSSNDSASNGTDSTNRESMSSSSLNEDLWPQPLKSPTEKSIEGSESYENLDDDNEGFMQLKADSPKPEDKPRRPSSVRRLPQRTKSFEGFKSPPVNQRHLTANDGFSELSSSNHGFSVSPRSPGSLKSAMKARRPERDGLSSSLHGLSSHGTPRSPGSLMVKARKIANGEDSDEMPILSRSRSRSPGTLRSRSPGTLRSRSPGTLRNPSTHGSTWGDSESGGSRHSRSARLNRTVVSMQDAFDVDPFAAHDTDPDDDDFDGFGDSASGFPEADFDDPDFVQPTPTKTLQPTSIRNLASELQVLKQSFGTNDQTARQAQLESELEALKNSLQQREADMMQKLSAKDEMIQRLAEQVEAVSLSASQHSTGKIKRRGSTGALSGKGKPKRRSSFSAMSEVKASHRSKRRSKSNASASAPISLDDEKSIVSFSEDKEIDGEDLASVGDEVDEEKKQKSVSLGDKLSKEKKQRKKKSSDEVSLSSKRSKRSSKSSRSLKSKSKKKSSSSDEVSVTSKSSSRKGKKSSKKKSKSKRIIAEEVVEVD